MALSWSTWRCQSCAGEVQLPVIWLRNRHSRALRCILCNGLLRPCGPRRARRAS
jgi:hypothetical protein